MNPSNPHRMAPFSKKKWICIQLPQTGYGTVSKLQADLVTARWERRLEMDAVLLLEHPPVFTLGRRGGKENLTLSEDVLTSKGIPIIQTERGGDITYHGPGQLVIYPVIDLASARLGVADYVGMLEEVIIRVTAEWGITAGRDPRNRGVWVGNSKLASIGIAVRHGITFHGVALNVNLDLEPFRWIHPCGIQGIGMTSLEKELERSVSMDDVRRALRRHMEDIFGVEFVMTGIKELGAGFPVEVKDAVWNPQLASF